METLDETLRERIDVLIGPSEVRQPLLSTTGAQVAIAELIARSDRLEKAVAEITLELEKLAASQGPGGSRRAAEPPSTSVR